MRRVACRQRVWISVLLIGLLLGVPAPNGLGDVLDDAETAALASSRGEYGKAVYFLTRVIDSGAVKGWELSVALTRRADALAALGARKAALADYDAAIAIAAGNTDALVNRGLTYHELGRFEAAIADFNTVLQIDPTHIPARYNRGLSLGSIGALAGSMRDLDAVVSAWPDFAQAYNDRGVIYSELGLNDRAIRNFDTAIRLDPDLAVAHFNRAVVHLRSGRPDVALAGLDRAVALLPDEPDLLFLRAQVLYALDRAAAGRDDLRRARNIDPRLCERMAGNPGLARLGRNLCD